MKNTTKTAVIAVLLAATACASDSQREVFKVASGSVLIEYGGGDGSSCKQAVEILGVSGLTDGVSAEDLWLSQHHPGYVRVGSAIEVPFCYQDCENVEQKVWEVVRLRGPDGQEIEVCFDVTIFH